MEIVDLTDENVSHALCGREGGREERKKFLLWMLKEGKVRGKIAIEGGEGLGWIDYYPRSDGWIRIGCIDVDKGSRGRGVGRALMNACLADCKGSKGLIVAATSWEHMPKGFFKKFGFVDIDEKANISLMRVMFGNEEAPKREKEKIDKPKIKLVEGKLTIDAFDDGECPTLYITRQLIKEEARNFDEKIVIREHDTKDKAVVEEFGDAEGVFIDGEKAFFGYPGSLEGIRSILRRKLEDRKLL